METYVRSQLPTDGKNRAIEWVRAKDEKDGYWIESEITIDKIYDFKIDHKLLSDAERIHERNYRI